MPHRKPSPKDAKKPFIIVIDSMAFGGHLGILRARLGDKVVDETIEYFGKVGVGHPRESMRLMEQFSLQVKKRRRASGYNPAAVFSCPIFLAEFYRESEPILPKGKIFILPTVSEASYCGNDAILADVWEKAKKRNHVFKNDDREVEELLLKDNSTAVSWALEKEILKIRPDITPKRLSRESALKAYREGELGLVRSSYSQGRS